MLLQDTSPFHLVYGRQAILPIETIIPTEPNPDVDREIDLQDSILQRAYKLIDKMPYSQNDARLNTERSQQKQKEYFNNKIRPEKYEISDKVWIQRKEIEKSRSAKFEDKRFGLFIIQEKLNNSAYKLRNNEGQVLQKYYNSDRLAKYYEKQTWEPIVVIENQ